MNHWILKSEPDVFSWQQFEKDGKAMWDGVRSFQARNNLKDMKKGDLFFFYHSNIGKEIVGIGKVIKEHYPDPTADDDKWVAIDVAPVKALSQPVTLKRIKEDPALQNIALVRLSRLSVMPLKKEEFEYILKLSGK